MMNQHFGVILHLVLVVMQHVDLFALTVVPPLLYDSLLSHSASAGPDGMNREQDRAPGPQRMWREYVNGPGSRGYLVFARWMKFSPHLSFPHFLSHVCVTRLVKSLSLKLPRSTGQQSEKLSNMRKSEGEKRMGRRWEKLGQGWLQIVCLMAATQEAISGDLLSVMRAAELPGSLFSLLFSVGHHCLRASGYHQWPRLLKLLCLQFYMPFRASLMLSPRLSLSHFASSSLQCVSLASAQQLLFSDRSVKQKMMLGEKNPN